MDLEPKDHPSDRHYDRFLVVKKFLLGSIKPTQKTYNITKEELMREIGLAY